MVTIISRDHDKCPLTNHHPLAHKLAVVRILMTRADALSSLGVERAQEEKEVATALNGFPSGFICRHSWSGRPRPPTDDQRPKTSLTLPYIGGLLEAIRQVLWATVTHHTLSSHCFWSVLSTSNIHWRWIAGYRIQVRTALHRHSLHKHRNANRSTHTHIRSHKSHGLTWTYMQINFTWSKLTCNVNNGLFTRSNLEHHICLCTVQVVKNTMQIATMYTNLKWIIK